MEPQDSFWCGERDTPGVLWWLVLLLSWALSWVQENLVSPTLPRCSAWSANSSSLSVHTATPAPKENEGWVFIQQPENQHSLDWRLETPHCRAGNELKTKQETKIIPLSLRTKRWESRSPSRFSQCTQADWFRLLEEYQEHVQLRGFRWGQSQGKRTYQIVLKGIRNSVFLITLSILQSLRCLTALHNQAPKVHLGRSILLKASLPLL